MKISYNKVKLIIYPICFFLYSGCGVKGMPQPPDDPPTIGEGYKGWQKKIEVNKIENSENSENDQKIENRTEDKYRVESKITEDNITEDNSKEKNNKKNKAVKTKQ